MSASPISPLAEGAAACFAAVQFIVSSIQAVLAAIVLRIGYIAVAIFQIGRHPENGVVGEGHFSPNVRLLYVNGLSSDAEKCQRISSAISSIFDGRVVSYTYLPLRLDQVARAILFAYRPASCDYLVQNIRTQLLELGVGSEKTWKDCSIWPTLKIFAHSAGGAMLGVIRDELTLEERSHIEVYSFGSAHLFDATDGFLNATNIAASGDPIPRVCRVVNRFAHSDAEMMDVGTPTALSLANHGIRGEPYEMALWHIRVNAE
jgi:hypothetical protein